MKKNYNEVKGNENKNNNNEERFNMNNTITLKEAGELIPRKPETIRQWVKKGIINNYGDKKLIKVNKDELLVAYNNTNQKFKFNTTVEDKLKETPDVKIKKCPKCGRELPETVEFFNKSGTGFQSYCRECNANNLKEFKEKNPNYSKEYYNKNYWETVISTHKSQARALNLDDSLTIEEWYTCLNFFDNKCAYCGSNQELQVEHMVPKKQGGTCTKDNIVCACKKCNKNKGSLELSMWAAKNNINLQKVSDYLNFISK